MNKIAVIIVAAGRGSRAGEGTPKQYRPLCGTPLLRRTLDTVLQSLPGAHIQLVIHPDDTELLEDAVQGLPLPNPVHGGKTRQESVLNGLRALQPIAPDFVLVHDAARPFTAEHIFTGVVSALKGGAKAVVPAVAVVDTINRCFEGKQIEAVDRNGLFAIQTPQGFEYAALLAAHEQANSSEFTDDGTVMKAAGHEIHISEGSERNFKVTEKTDFSRAETQIMTSLADIRIGQGYDVHRFDAGDHLWLCGVKIPFTKTLKGHSDADVALHALTDALLSAVSEGDIGTHFPPSDPQWRGAPSHIFLEKARTLIAEKGGVIAHVTILMICEKPKIGPHKDSMRAKIAELLQIDIARVSVQATTTEKLGFTGREEGIAAQATTTVRLPF